MFGNKHNNSSYLKNQLLKINEQNLILFLKSKKNILNNMKEKINLK